MWFLLVVLGLCNSCKASGADDVLLTTSSPVPTNKKINAPTCELAVMDGYKCETHEVTTEDGFILNVHRLSGVKHDRDPSLLPVLLQHGLLASSASWLIGGPQRALAYILADQGYDVWMGNARGNTYSRLNRSLHPDDPRFWTWSWHEMGYYDLPAVIDHMLAKTGHQQIFYVGHSMGTTMFFVLCSTRPEYNAKVRYMAALAPVAFVKHTACPIRHLTPYAHNIEKVANFIGKGEFFPQSTTLDFFKITCGTLSCKIGKKWMFMMYGTDPEEFDKTLVPIIMGHSPSGTSARTFVHYAQGINTNLFQKYDFGEANNILVYGTENPPNYNLSMITVPISLHYGDNDLICTPKDIIHLFWRLPNAVGLFRVNQPSFNHLDFQYGRNVKSLVYDKLIAFIKWFQDGQVNCNDATRSDYVAELCESLDADFNVDIKGESSITKVISRMKKFLLGLDLYMELL